MGLIITVISMGLFKKIFNKSEINQQSKNLQPENEYQEKWEFYFSNVDDKVSSIFVDLGLHKIAPIKNESNLIWISITMNNPDKNGLSSQEESGILGIIGKDLVNKITAKFKSTYAGRLTSDGRRDFYFYVDQTKLYDKAISEVMAVYPKYNFTIGSKEDKNWSYYFDFLYPKPEELQRISNRQIIDELKKGGDILKKEREVDHWIYFETEKDRDKFISKIKKDDFDIVEQKFDESEKKFPFILHIKRVDKVDLESVNEYVIYLWKIAVECNGEYDGWRTTIEAD